ncbi:unnamed protein product, partial [Mesorhabditis spiculigera]
MRFVLYFYTLASVFRLGACLRGDSCWDNSDCRGAGAFYCDAKTRRCLQIEILEPGYYCVVEPRRRCVQCFALPCPLQASCVPRFTGTVGEILGI